MKDGVTPAKKELKSGFCCDMFDQWRYQQALDDVHIKEFLDGSLFANKVKHPF